MWHLKNNKHHNTHLQKDFNKYGKNNFKFHILEFCNIEELEEKEQYWISKLKSNQEKYGYNRRIDVETNRGLKLLEETKLKISKTLKGKKLTLSEEQKRHLSFKHRGSNNPSAKLTEGDVVKIKELLKNTKMTQRDIARLFGVDSRRIRAIKNGESWKHVI